MQSEVEQATGGSGLYRPEFEYKQKEGASKDTNKTLWHLMDQYIASDKQTIQKSIVTHVEYTLAKTRFNFEKIHAYLATSQSVKDRLIE